MRRTLERLFLSAGLLAGISLVTPGCTAMDPAGDKAPGADLSSGKFDGSLEIVDQGPLTLSESVSATLEENIAHSWTFELTGPADVSFTTTGDDGLDTVVYLLDGETELDSDDDGGAGYFSNLAVALDAGTYNITVGGYNNTQTGSFNLASTCAGEGCGEGVEPADPWDPARDVNLHNVVFSDAATTPEMFTRADAGFVSLSSPEWWQRWSGGATQSFSWNEGTDYGKRCGQASAIRLQAIWEHEVVVDGEVTYPGQEAFEALRDGSGWSRTMYNWTEDVSEGGRASFSPATMWAWRTGAIKFINVVRPDGSCDLPTLGLVQDFVETCLARAASNDGEIQGCRASL